MSDLTLTPFERERFTRFIERAVADIKAEPPAIDLGMGHTAIADAAQAHAYRHLAADAVESRLYSALAEIPGTDD